MDAWLEKLSRVNTLVNGHLLVLVPVLALVLFALERRSLVCTVGAAAGALSWAIAYFTELGVIQHRTVAIMAASVLTLLAWLCLLRMMMGA